MKQLLRCIVFLSGIILCGTLAYGQVPTGTPPFSSSTAAPDTIDLGNLNIHIDVPILQKAGRSTNFTYDYTYDSSVWYPVTSGSTKMWQPVLNWGWRGQTEVTTGYVSYWVASMQCIISKQTITTNAYYNFVYHDAQGVPHPFIGEIESPCPGYNPSMTVTSNDGSGYIIKATWSSYAPTGTITSKQGTVFNPPFSAGTGAGNFTDRNGNEITVNGSGQFYDTLSSTTPVLTVSGSGTTSSPLTFTYTAPSNAPAAYTANYTNYTVATNFGDGQIGEYKSTSPIPLVTSITLPDGSQYKFSYETTPGSCTPVTGTTACVTARIATVTFPQSGEIKYTYTGGYNGIFADGSTAGLKRSTPDTGSNTWVYSRVQETGAASITTVTDPSSQANQSIIQFQNIYETQRDVYSGAAPTITTFPIPETTLQTSSLLKEVQTCYNGNTTNCTSTAVTTPITQRNVSNLLGGPNKKTDLHSQTFDSYGNILSQSDYDYGTGAKGSLLATTTITYATLTNITAFQQQVTVANGSGQTVSQTYYNYGDTVSTSSGTPQHTSPLGSRGNLLSVNYYTNSSNYLTKSYTYYDTGTIIKATDVNLGVTTYGYPDSTSTCGNAFPTQMTEAVTTLIQHYTWNCTGGVQTSVKDENSQTATATYTEAYFWRPSAVTDALSNQTSVGYLIPMNGWNTSLTFSNGSGNSQVNTGTGLDGLGRQVVLNHQSSSTPTWDMQTMSYDTNGRQSAVSLPCNSTGAWTCPTQGQTTTAYDALDRVTQVTAGDGGTTTYTYTDNDVTIAVAGSGDSTKTRQLEYNSLGQLTSVCEVTSTLPGNGPCGQTNSKTGYLTTYGHTPLGQIAQVTENSQPRRYQYDFLGRLISEVNPENGTTTYQYDTFPSSCYNYGDNQNGNLTGKTDNIGNTNCYHYDALHRLLDVGSTGSAKNYCKRFRYDTPGNGVDGSAPSQIGNSNVTYVAGRLMEAETDNCGAWPPTNSNILTDEWFAYDQDGRSTNLWEHTPNSGSGYYYPIAATYWPHGMVNTISGVPGLPSITFSPDYEGRINTVSASSGQNPVIASGSNPGTTYNPASQVMRINFGSGNYDTFGYDSNTDRMTQYAFNVGGQTESGALTWNGTGTLQTLGISDPFNSTNNQSCQYSHDDLVRLSSVNCTYNSNTVWQQTFTYDAFGNIKYTGTGSFQPTYSSSTNQITQIGSSNTSYDADGNVLNDTIHQFTWDVYGLPATVDAITMTYDALGRMVERNNNGSITQVVYTPGGAKLAIMTGTTLDYGYVPLPGGAVAQYSSNGGFYYRNPDWQGSTRLVTQEGTPWVFSDGAYSPFGFPYAGNADYSFTGMNQDTSGGLYDFPAREYEWQGRWPSPDPAGFSVADPTNPQTWNRYAYVSNNPLSFTDPTGMNQDNTCSGADNETCGDEGDGDVGGSDSGFGGILGLGGSSIIDLSNFIISTTVWVQAAGCQMSDPSCQFPYQESLQNIGSGSSSGWWITFGKTFANGVAHGVRKRGQSVRACIAQNASETTNGLTTRVSTAAYGAAVSTGAAIGALSQIPSPWAQSANTIVSSIGQQVGQAPNPVSLTLGGTIGGFIARSLGAGFGATRMAIGAATGLTTAAAYGTVAAVGGTVGLYIGSAINCR